MPKWAFNKACLFQVVVAYAADKKWLNALFCQKTPPAVSDKQRQIELGTLSPGESTYRTSSFPFLVCPGDAKN